MFAREADEAFPLGPASARPYIDLAALERVLVECARGRGLGRAGGSSPRTPRSRTCASASA